jgi:hypothetical protein
MIVERKNTLKQKNRTFENKKLQIWKSWTL